MDKVNPIIEKEPTKLQNIINTKFNTPDEFYKHFGDEKTYNFLTTGYFGFNIFWKYAASHCADSKFIQSISKEHILKIVELVGDLIKNPKPKNTKILIGKGCSSIFSLWLDNKFDELMKNIVIDVDCPDGYYAVPFESIYSNTSICGANYFVCKNLFEHLSLIFDVYFSVCEYLYINGSSEYVQYGYDDIVRYYSFIFAVVDNKAVLVGFDNKN